MVRLDRRSVRWLCAAIVPNFFRSLSLTLCSLLCLALRFSSIVSLLHVTYIFSITRMSSSHRQHSIQAYAQQTHTQPHARTGTPYRRIESNAGHVHCDIHRETARRHSSSQKKNQHPNGGREQKPLKTSTIHTKKNVDFQSHRRNRKNQNQN